MSAIYRGDDSDIVELMRENAALEAKLAAAEAALASMTAERDALRKEIDADVVAEGELITRLDAAQARAERLAEALRRILSCAWRYPSDAVEIARAALAEPASGDGGREETERGK